MTYSIWQDEKIAARCMAGNWKKERNFSWWGRDDNEPRNDQAVHYGLYNRDSDPLDLSNGKVMIRELEKIDPEGRNWHVENFSHWLCGWIEVLVIFPYYKGAVKRLTPAWLKFCEMVYNKEQYPVLDEDHYCQTVQEEVVEPAFEEITRLVNQLMNLEHDYIGEDVTTVKVWEVYDELGLEYEDGDRVYHYDATRNHIYEEDVVRLISDWLVENEIERNGENFLAEVES